MAVERGPDSRAEPRLDALARSLAGEPVSRRTTLKGAAVVAGGAAVSSPLWGWAERAAAAVAHKPRCKHGHASCGHGCCKPNQVCVHPKRKKHSRKTPKPKCECLTPHKQCSSGCVDVRSDPHNCGACGKHCPSGQVCSHGQCGLHCPAGEAACGGACVNLQTDAHNCGHCGTVCAAPAGGAASCVGGVCQESCSMAGQTACAGACVSLATDANNCGTCGHECSSGEVCSGGQCMTSCPSGETACGSSCVNLQTDPANCNGCGTVCPPPTGGVATCAGGVCGQQCTTSGETACAGTCVNTQTNASNCGECGLNCADNANGHICVSGTCGCSAASDCPANNRCTAATCVPLLINGAACSANEQCLNGACVPDATNTNNSICCASSCSNQGTASCGTNGTCQHDGSACALYSSETQCEPALCNANTGQFTPHRFCDGAGTCSPANAMDCAPYTCDGSGCLTFCEGPDDCIPSATCESGMCAAGI